MRAFLSLWLLLLIPPWAGCAAAPQASIPQGWNDAEETCATHDDQCVSLLCMGDACGFYRCQDMGGAIELARFPPARPPAAAAAPGRGPRRSWGGGQHLPRGAVMLFPHWNGAHDRVFSAPPRLTPGRWEKHHIFPQAEDLARWFERQGVKIHDYAMPIPRHVHQRIHRGGERGGEWNRAWREFKDANEGAGPIQPYYSRPGA